MGVCVCVCSESDDRIRRWQHLVSYYCLIFMSHRVVFFSPTTKNWGTSSISFRFPYQLKRVFICVNLRLYECVCLWVLRGEDGDWVFFSFVTEGVVVVDAYGNVWIEVYVCK